MSKYVDTQLVDQMAESNWSSRVELRNEFRGNKAAYMAYWRAVARGQTPLPRQAAATQPVTTFAPAPIRAAPAQAANAGRVAASSATNIRAFWQLHPAEAAKQYPNEVRRFEQERAQSHV